MEIEGYENYLIYEDGRVYTKKYNRFLTQRNHNKGYYEIKLSKNGKEKIFKLHRLIALHYIPNPENKPCIDHINRDRKDNRIENLRWATCSENQQNTIVRASNKLGIKNIHYDKIHNKYKYKKILNKKLEVKYFKTLEEAIEYKRVFELNNCS